VNILLTSFKDFYESLATERQEAESSDAPIINIPTNPFATPAQHTNNATSTPEETIAHRRRRRERQNHALGTIEDVQQDDYVSPITGMFTRAYDRFRVAEEVRQAEARFTTMHLSELSGGPPAPTSLPIAQYRQQQRSNFHRQFYHHQDSSSPLQSLPHPEPDPMDEGPNPVDLQTLQRPTPSSAESLKVDFACKVCCEQKVNVINEPCMHACMCQWCAGILRSECRNEQGRFDGRLWRCPICRARITQVRKFYIE